MKNAEKAQELWGIITNQDRPATERLAAQSELMELKKKAKVSWEKLGLTSAVADYSLGENADELDPLDEPAVDPKAKHTGPSVAAVAGKKTPKPKKEGDLRGKISERVRELLLGSDDPYDTVREKVRAEFPHAVTTNRSLASVASEMRKKGEKVPQRRKPAKEKE